MSPRVVLAAALALAASAVPLHAEIQDTPPSEAPLSPAAEESLKCAIWASYFGVTYDGREEAEAFYNALSYFVGRYEGLTGRGIDTALDEDLIVATADSIDDLTPVCLARMDEYGSRMTDWGKALDAIGDRLPDERPGEVS